MWKSGRKAKHLGFIDNWLESLGYYRKNIPHDETCLFRAVSEQIFGCQLHHERVRKECVSYGKTHYDEFSDLVSDEEMWLKMLDLLERHMKICDDVELQILSKVYERDIIIFDGLDQKIMDVTNNEYSKQFLLYSTGKDHYDVIYEKAHIENAGFCQSIAYKILYENVFGIDDVDETVSNMLYDKLSLSEKFDETDNNNGHVAPFPYRIAKAMDPNIYRNIEYDSWGEIRKEIRLSGWYYGDDKLTLGTKCMYTDSNGKRLECYIQEKSTDEDKCVIYITSSAEKKVVDYSELSPEDNAKPWPLPYRFTREKATTPVEVAPIDKKLRAKKKGRNNSKAKTFLGAPLRMQPPKSAEVLSNSEYDELPQWQSFTAGSTTSNPFLWPVSGGGSIVKSTPGTPQTPFPADPFGFYQCNQPNFYPDLTPPSDPGDYPNPFPEPIGTAGYTSVPPGLPGPSEMTPTKPTMTLNISAPNRPVEIFSPVHPMMNPPTFVASTPVQEMTEMVYPTTPVIFTHFNPQTGPYYYPPTPPPTWYSYPGGFPYPPA